MDLKLEVVVIPVSDVDRAKRFYQTLGWRLDADFPFDNGFRVVIEAARDALAARGAQSSDVFHAGTLPGTVESFRLRRRKNNGGQYHRLIDSSSVSGLISNRAVERP